MNEMAIRLYNAITDIDDELIEKANQTPQKKRLKPVFKVMLIAAAIVALFISGLSVYATSNNTDIPSLLLKVSGKWTEFEGSLEKLENTQADGYAYLDSDFANDMKKLGISPVTVPEFFTESDFSYEDMPANKEDISFLMTYADMNFKWGEYNGNFSIEQYVDPPDDSGASTLGFSNVENGKIVKANGMDIIVLGAEYASHLYYRDHNTIYVISIENMDYETAIKIAESIK